MMLANMLAFHPTREVCLTLSAAQIRERFLQVGLSADWALEGAIDPQPPRGQKPVSPVAVGAVAMHPMLRSFAASPNLERLGGQSQGARQIADRTADEMRSLAQSSVDLDWIRVASGRWVSFEEGWVRAIAFQLASGKAPDDKVILGEDNLVAHAGPGYANRITTVRRFDQLLALGRPISRAAERRAALIEACTAAGDKLGTGATPDVRAALGGLAGELEELRQIHAGLRPTAWGRWHSETIMIR